jgi:hypothetical protein
MLVVVRARRDQSKPKGNPKEGAAQVTANVEQRALTTSLRLPASYVLEDRITVTAGSAGETTTGPQYLTKAPPAAGVAVGPGAVVAEVNYRPVLLVAASLPFFRQIRPGTAGGDVATLQEGLRSMGHAVPEEESGTFGATTRAALEAIYLAAGYEPPFTQGTRAATEAAVEAAWQASDEAYDVANAATLRGEDAAELVPADGSSSRTSTGSFSPLLKNWPWSKDWGGTGTPVLGVPAPVIFGTTPRPALRRLPAEPRSRSTG